MSIDNDPRDSAQQLPPPQGARYPERKYNIYIFIFAIAVFSSLTIIAGTAAFKDEGLLMSILIIMGGLAAIVLPLFILLLSNYAWYELSPDAIIYKFPSRKLKVIKWFEVIEFGPTGGAAEFMIKDNKGTKIIIGGSTPDIKEILTKAAKYLHEKSPEAPESQKPLSLRDNENLAARLKSIRRRGNRMAAFLTASLFAYILGSAFVMSKLDFRTMNDVTVIVVVALFIIVLLAIFLIFYIIGRALSRKDPLCPSCGRPLREIELILRTSKCPLCGRRIL